MTSDYTSGMIRPTLIAAPRRPLLLAAKAAVFGAVGLTVGEVASFASFFASDMAVGHGIPAPALSQPGVLREVILTGASYCLIGLLGLRAGAIIRHTAAAIVVLVAGVCVAAQLAGEIVNMTRYAPITTRSGTRPAGKRSLPPSTGRRSAGAPMTCGTRRCRCG